METAATPGFQFGANWRRFLDVVDDRRVAEAERSLNEMLGPDALAGRTFLDIGCGQRALLARRRSARREPGPLVRLRPRERRVRARAPAPVRARHARPWTIEQGSVLDAAYLRGARPLRRRLLVGRPAPHGRHVAAIENATLPVAPRREAVHLDLQRPRTAAASWRAVKRVYNRLPASARTPYAVAVMAPREAMSAAKLTARGRPLDYVRAWTRLPPRARHEPLA